MYFNAVGWTQLLWKMDCLQSRLEDPTTSQGLLNSLNLFWDEHDKVGDPLPILVHCFLWLSPSGKQGHLASMTEWRGLWFCGMNKTYLHGFQNFAMDINGLLSRQEKEKDIKWLEENKTTPKINKPWSNL